MNRRNFIRSMPAATAGVALARWVGAAEPARSAAASPGVDPVAELAIVPLANGLSVVTGGGGNVTVFHSPEGVLLVDGGSVERAAQVLKLVKAHTGATKIHTLFNTHWHWDQTGSNRMLGPQATRIIAHENTKLWLGTQIFSKWQQRLYPPLPRDARPNQTFYTSGSLTFGGEHIDYGYLPQAHTDGDLYVFFRNANVLVAGDVVAVGSYPILDYSTNGWIGGMLEATKTLLGLCDRATRIVPGFGALQTRLDLEAERDMLATMKVRLSQLLAKGMSVPDMLAAAPSREFDAHWGDPTLFIANAWAGLVPRARELGVNIV
ncbi:MAG TPA: MBL fold metallo-hydrolase [Steroidobacteraceae bacterium]|jgi:glyoxylase-like metal-dependent hydrolase (beta-lactamase superfamily II)